MINWEIVLIFGLFPIKIKNMTRTTRVRRDKTEKGLGSGINYCQQTSISETHFKAGCIKDKIPIPLSDGKTIVFAKEGSDIEKVRERWEHREKM